MVVAFEEPGLHPGGAPNPHFKAPTAPVHLYQKFYNNMNMICTMGMALHSPASNFCNTCGRPAQPTQNMSDAVFASGMVDPQAFIMLINNKSNPDGTIHLFHCLQLYVPQLGIPTPLNNKGCGCIPWRHCVGPGATIYRQAQQCISSNHCISVSAGAQCD